RAGRARHPRGVRRTRGRRRPGVAKVEARRESRALDRLASGAMQPGSIIGGRYQLVDIVAEGGLSTVWQGVSRATEVFARPVAIKVMKREFSTIGGPYLSMFLEE